MQYGVTMEFASCLYENFKQAIGGKFASTNSNLIPIDVFDLVILPLSNGDPTPAKLKYYRTTKEEYQRWLKAMNPKDVTLEFVTNREKTSFVNFFQIVEPNMYSKMIKETK